MKNYKEKRRELLEDEIRQTEIHNNGYLFTRDTISAIFTCVGAVVVSKWVTEKVVAHIEKRQAKKRFENTEEIR